MLHPTARIQENQNNYTNEKAEKAEKEKQKLEWISKKEGYHSRVLFSECVIVCVYQGFLDRGFASCV